MSVSVCLSTGPTYANFHFLDLANAPRGQTGRHLETPWLSCFHSQTGFRKSTIFNHNVWNILFWSINLACFISNIQYPHIGTYHNTLYWLPWTHLLQVHLSIIILFFFFRPSFFFSSPGTRVQSIIILAKIWIILEFSWKVSLACPYHSIISTSKFFL